MQVDEETKEAFLNVFDDGNDLFKTFWNERFKEKSKPISAVIHKAMLPSFDSQPQFNPLLPETSKSQSMKSKLRGEKIIDLARERGYPLEKLLSYDIVDNHFLFDGDGLLTKTDKSSLVVELEKILGKSRITEYIPTNSKNCCIVDSMSYLRKMSPSTIEDKTVKGFSETFLNILNNNIPKSTSRIDLIFDSYVENSPKAYERLRRNCKGAIEVNTIEDNVHVPKQIDKFWTSNENKVKLQAYIKKFALRNRHSFHQVVL